MDGKFATLLLTLLGIASAVATPVSAQVRTKKPDRGVYQSPSLDVESTEMEIADLVRERQPIEAPIRPRIEAPSQVDRSESSAPDNPMRESSSPIDSFDQEDEASAAVPAPLRTVSQPLKTVGHDAVILVQPHRPGIVVETESPGGISGDVIWDENNVIHDGTCDGCIDCDLGYGETFGCDSMGCDAIGCDVAPWYRRWANTTLSRNPDRWFASAELMLMFRKGDHLPPLVTTSNDPNPDPDTAGELPGAPILAGGGKVLDDLRLGGRFTLGTWLDSRQCQSLVLRGWFAGEETYDFGTNQDQNAVIARPFFNVSDNQAAEQDTQLIAFPNRANGSVNVHASSDVHGADVAIRQFWYGRFGGAVEVLYGYQYMRLDEDLSISSSSTSLDGNFAPLGSVIAITDTFDAENEFHGGQLGLAFRYRERCWSFNGLVKAGFGSLSRRAIRNGSTFTSNAGANATDPNGLLVRSTNSGELNDSTFGWIPELDLSLGWQRFPRFDVTVGYHIVAMTDALQVSGMIDPELAVNLSVPPTGRQSPSATLQTETFYVQGIHFGLQYVY